MTPQNRAARGVAFILVVMLAGSFCLSAWAKASDAEKGNTGNSASVAAADADANTPRVQEQEAPAKVAKKRFPWFWVAVGAVAVGVILYFTVIKKPEYKLSVSKGAGVSGTPAVGTFVYRKGKKVRYSYSYDYGYRNLKVLLDGAEIAAAGEFKMDGDHVLAVSADEQSYSLMVSAALGVIGTPAPGTVRYKQGASVAYSYALAAGYSDLQVKLDGVEVAAAGEFTMDRDRVLAVTANRHLYDLMVTVTVGVNGTPAAGTTSHEPGSSVAYKYWLADGNYILRVKLDGILVVPRGLVAMEADHTLEASAELIMPPKFDIQGRWRIRATTSYYMFDTQELIFVGTPAAGKIYPPNSSSYSIGAYIVSGDRITFWASTDYAHSTDFWGTLRDTNDMDGPCYRNPCDYPDGGPGTWAAVRVP